MHLTLEEIREEGILALRERLGREGMVRFLQQFELGSGDYAKSRRKWAERLTIDEIRRQSKLGRKPRTKKR